jgi:type I restriction enzyme S subunit
MKTDLIGDAEDHITDAAVRGSSTNVVSAGAVLAVTRSGILRRTFPVAVTTCAVTINQDLKALKPVDGINPRYVAWCLRRDQQSILHECTKDGTTVDSIDFPALLRWLIPIAPSAEQDRIVAVIEKQFSQLNTGIALLERARQRLKRMRAAVLEAAVPSVGEQKVLKVPLGDLTSPARKVAYGVLVPGDHDPEGVPLVRVGDLSNRRVSPQGLKHIAPAIAARYPRTRLQGGEVLLSLVGTIGRTAVVPLELAGANTARAIAVIPVQEGIEPRYIAIALSPDRVTRELTDLSHEVARKTLNLEDVRRYEIPLPSYQEQLRIVKAVETEETRIKSVEEAVARAFRRAAHFRSAILQAAFSGRLVPQDEGDEPASALLALVASERAASSGQRLGRGRKPRFLQEGARA